MSMTAEELDDYLHNFGDTALADGDPEAFCRVLDTALADIEADGLPAEALADIRAKMSHLKKLAWEKL